ncbi:outer membrane protein assembly factor BamB family protein [Nocardioides pacificus]
MNHPPAGPCVYCGSPLSPGATFCPRCGAGGPAQQAQQQWQQPQQSWQQQGWQQQGWQQGQQPGWQQPEQPRRGRRTGLLVGVGALVVLLVAGGVFLGIRLLGGDGDEARSLGANGSELVDPVTSEPEETWSWEAPGEVGGAVQQGDSLVITVEGGEVVSLDASGDEEWTTTVDSDISVSHAVPGQDVLIAAAYDVQRVTALSAEDGEQLWTYDDRTFESVIEEGVIFRGLDESGLLDAKTGDELWTVETPDAYAIASDAAYLLAGDELTKVSLEDGDEQWSVTVDRDEDAYGTLTATDEFVVVDGDELMAFDAESGDELWSEEGGEDGSRASVFSATEVYVTANDYGGESEPSVTVFDRDGKVGELDVEKEGDSEYFYFYAMAFESGGSSYALDYTSGRLYGDDLEVLQTYEGSLAVAAGGLYALDDQKLSYFELGSDSAEWSIDIEAEEGGVGAIDGRVLVYTEDTVINYE